jgi:NADPH-dependent 2,4-dienoyl-CoA reductase/sulfur reductase-like enzyme
VIAGGGLAAARAITSYREAGGEGRIALLSQEPTPPYHRPPLSKGYLRGETDAAPLVEDEVFYRDHDVELLLETPVTSIAPGEHTVTAAGGALYGYEQLLIATGARPRRLPVPGADLDGVLSLRTLADSDAIRDAARSGTRAVVVGGGFIGVEVAASLRARDVDVTLVHLGSGLFDQLGSPQLTDELADLYRANGVGLLLGEEVASFGGGAELEFVTTKSGRRLDADFAVVGAGVVPNVDFLAGSGLELDNGVVVDERYQTGVPGIFAVGDVANFFDPLYGRRRRIEHWSNADYQGTQIGRLLAGEDGGYDTVSSFFTKVFDVGLQVFGDVSRFDDRATEGSLADRDLVVTYGEGGRVVGALASAPSEELATGLKQLIADHALMPTPAR